MVSLEVCERLDALSHHFSATSSATGFIITPLLGTIIEAEENSGQNTTAAGPEPKQLASAELVR